MDDSQHTLDHDLVAAILRGDEAAAIAFWNRHGHVLLTYASAIRPDGADDAVQAVFCRLLSLSARSVGAVVDWRGLLVTMVRREVLNRIREQRRRAQWHALAATRPPNTALPRHAHATHIEGVEAALERLPRRLREVVVLRHAASLSFDQIATAVGCNRNTLASRYAAAIVLLRTWVDPDTHHHATAEVIHV